MELRLYIVTLILVSRSRLDLVNLILDMKDGEK